LEPFERRQRPNGFAGLLFGEADLIKALQIQPEFRGGAEEMGKAQGCIAGDGPPSIQDFGDSVGRDIQLPRKFGGAHAERFEFFRKMLSWMNGRYWHGISP
jgi:hypothetical protein